MASDLPATSASPASAPPASAPPASAAPTAAHPAAPVPPGGHVARVHVPVRSLRSELRAIRVVWWRELIRFERDRLRIITSLIQPFLFLFVLGTGISTLAATGTHGVNFKTFIYPGVLCMTVMFTAMFSAASIVWDREFGFLREMMVAPVRRSSVVLGKVLGGTTVAAFQGVIVIAIAGLVEVPYDPVLILELLVLSLLLAFAITAFGVMVAVRISQLQAFMALMQMAIMPMFFLSGAMFSVASLPGWLAFLTRIDPLTYAVDPMRRAIFSHLNNVSPAARAALVPGVTLFGWTVPGVLEAALIAVLGLIMLAVAVWEFSRAE
jgi:ABC-2 type transport system permease protein